VKNLKKVLRFDVDWCGRETPSKTCQCYRCVSARFNAWQEKAKAAGTPMRYDKTVAVKKYEVPAHFRKHPHHLDHDPAMKKLIHEYIKEHRRLRRVK
jgi:hypothetical protein